MKTQSTSRHEILDHLEKGKKVGMYQDCAWLHDAQVGSMYRPGCKQNSLVIFEDSSRVMGRGEYPLYVCPEGCRCFTDRREHAIEQAKARRREWWWDKVCFLLSLPGLLIKPIWIEFRALHYFVQLFLLILLILLFAPHWIPSILELLRELKSLSPAP